LVAQAEQLTRDDVPVSEQWDLSKIYSSDEEWEADLGRARQLIEKAKSHSGKVGESAITLFQTLEDAMELYQTVETVGNYAALRRDEDTTNPAANARYERATALAIEAGQALAYLQPEILTIPEETLASFMEDWQLSTYRHMLDDIQRRRAHTRSVEVEQVLAQGADVARTARDVFTALDNGDLDYGLVEDDDGNPVTLTKGRFQLLMESKKRPVRERAYAALMGAYEAHKQTLSTLHGSSVRKDVFYARVRGHETAREAALFDDNIPESVYDSLIAAVREARPSSERYLKLRQRVLGGDQLEIYDLFVLLATLPERRYTFDEAVDIVLSGVRLLGDRYQSNLAEGFSSRWVDVHETKGKRSGAYSWGTYGAGPVILMNWNGTLDHVYTLAHEAGHAMHSLYSNRNQPYHDSHYPIFLAEIASTVNEVLLTWDLLAKTSEDDRSSRFSLLNHFADTFFQTLLRQAMLAEFEHRTHTVVERNEPITLESLNDLYGEMIAAHLPGVNIDDYARLNWSRVPHFYRAYYVFQYATGLSAAVAFATQIRDEGEPAVDRYLELLAAGGSDYSLPLLARAGVDLSTPEPVRAALAEFDSTVRQMEHLVEAGALAEQKTGVD
jgi:oligoendopeptidase F